jgi:carbon storage regulator CsrA
MLVLNRKHGEEIVIGDSIRVTVIEIRGNRVKLGFVSPREVRIVRAEICGEGLLCPLSESEAIPASIEPPLAV